jgi:AcrR family transcriptional regulator
VPRPATGRQALVEHAERLFAERGIEGVSLRDVCAAAGQRNHSAAQYHFGDRAGLVVAVYEARMTVVDQRRRALMAGLEAERRLDGVDGAVEAIVLPLLEVVTGIDSWYARFLARLRWDPFASDVVAGLPAAASFRDARDRLLGALAALPADVRRSRVDQLATLAIGTLAGWEWARHHDRSRLAAPALAAELLATASAMVRAPAMVAAPAAMARPADRTNAAG